MDGFGLGPFRSIGSSICVRGITTCKYGNTEIFFFWGKPDG